MKKTILLPGVAVLVVAAAGASYYAFGRTVDPVQAARADLQKGDARAALIQLRNAVRDNPSNGEAHALLGRTQLTQGDALAAEKELKAARDLNWDKTAVLIGLGQAYVAQNKWKDILAEIPVDAPTPEQRALLLIMRALAQNGLNNAPAAKATLALAEREAPNSAEARMVGARFALAAQDIKLAEQKADEALAIDAKRADALQLKGQIKAAAGDPQGAMALLDQAVEAAPTQTSVRLERANLLLNLGQDAKARADVDAVLAKEPRNLGATYIGMVLLVRAGKFAEADQALQKLDTVILRFPRGPYFQAMVKARLGQTEQAADMAARYVARSPNDPDGVRLLARIQILAKRPGKAVEALTKAVAAGQNDAETLDLLGRAYTLDGKRPEAARLFQQAANAAPGDSGIQARLASSKLQVGDTAGASSALERSLEIAPTQPGAGEALVATALSSGDLDRAQAALERLREQTGDTVAVGVLTGMLRLARLDVGGARDQFEATSRKFPDSMDAKLAVAKVLLLQNKRVEGIATLKEVLAKEPANPQALTTIVQVLTQEGRGPEAVAVVEAARASAPTNLALTAGQAELVARLGDPARGLTILDSARTSGGAMPPELLPLLARLQYATGKPDAAKVTYGQILSANPGDLDTRRAQVEALVNSGDVDGARASLREALKLSPGNAGMLTALVAIEQRAKGLDAAVALADQLRRDAVNMPAAGVLKGDLYMGAGKRPEAIAAYAAEFNATPNTTVALRLAGAQAADGAQAKAYSELKAWQAKQPTDADVAQTLASMDITARRNAEAEANLQVVLGQRPNDVVALNNLAWLYQLKGDGRARGLAQRAYLQAPTAETGDTLGWILVSQGEAAKALPILQQASAQRPDDRSIRFHLASAFKALDRREEALTLLRPLAEESAPFDEKGAAQQMLAELTKK